MHLRSARRALCALLVAVFLTAGLAPSAFASVAAKVSSSSAKVYKSASTKATSRKVPKNLNVSITSISGSWAKVSYKGNTAYMPIKHLSPTSKSKRYATASTAVYNASGKKLSTLSKGSSVYVLGTIGDKYLVMNSSGSMGYVKSGTLSKTKPAVSSVKTAKLSKVDQAIQIAKGQLGKPYKLWATAPHSFNCSSFVRYCMEKVGYRMQYTAATQAADRRYTKITSVSNLKKGDVLCFDTSGDGKVDHSAIYLGNNQFIEASRNAGKVQINTLDYWYQKHFVCARRPG